MQTLLVFSHLRWNFVYQRPQHLLSRLAKRWRVVFIEEPMVGEAEQRLERFSPADGVEVWRPHVTATAPGFHDDHISVLQRFVTEAVQAAKITDYWVWFYTPMAVPLAAELQPRGIVYDMAFAGFIRGAYVGPTPWDHPWVSPIEGDLTGYPLTVITAGTHDPIVDSARAFGERIRAAGGQTVEYFPAGMPHGYYFFPGVHAEENVAYEIVAEVLAKPFRR